MADPKSDHLFSDSKIHMMITDAELTILNLVAEGARYGQDIQEVIEKRGLREWVTIGYASVYYLLNKLEEQHMLTSELRSEGRLPARKLYSITEAGLGVLQTAIADRLRQPRPFGTGFELALANLTALKPAQVYHILQQHRVDLAQRLLMIEQSLQRQQRNGEVPEHVQALYSHSITMIEAEIKWLDDFMKKWSEHYPAVLKGMPSEEKDTSPPKADTRHHVHETLEDAKRIQKIPRSSETPDEKQPNNSFKHIQQLKRPKVSKPPTKPDDQPETPTALFPKEAFDVSSDEQVDGADSNGDC